MDYSKIYEDINKSITKEYLISVILDTYHALNSRNEEEAFDIIHEAVIAIEQEDSHL
jgi:hypothetical protein